LCDENKSSFVNCGFFGNLSVLQSSFTSKFHFGFGAAYIEILNDFFRILIQNRIRIPFKVSDPTGSGYGSTTLLIESV
jgi:hypothetical protein